MGGGGGGSEPRTGIIYIDFQENLMMRYFCLGGKLHVFGSFSGEFSWQKNPDPCNLVFQDLCRKFQDCLVDVGKGLIWVFPKIMVPPNHPLKNRVFHYFHHPFLGFSPYFWKHPSIHLDLPYCV